MDLHKLNIAAAETKKQLGERNFMAATNALYNFWLYELCDAYIVGHFPRASPSQPALSGGLGSDEADDGSHCSCGNAHLGAADALYVSGSRTAPAPSLQALCDGRAMATPFQTA